MQVQTATVTVTEEVTGIFLSEKDISGISYPLYSLLNLMAEDEASAYPAYSARERQTVRDLKALIDNLRSDRDNIDA